MMQSPEHIPVVIAGGGPVGLYLAISLHKKGLPCRILEKRKKPVPDSRSLGIHPVSLELFDSLQITEPFIQSGLKIRKGVALTGKETLGEISFESCKKPHNYILACPQFETEKILREILHGINPECLITGASFLDFKQNKGSVITRYQDETGTVKELSSKYLVGCDGKNSSVRKAASIHFSGKHYPDTYIMGDFEDTTRFGKDAAVFLHKDGLVECFPLPEGMRRWVVKTDRYYNEPDRTSIADLAGKRTGYDLSEIRSTMVSSFGVQHYIAETLNKNRVLLCGDAAHVVSPIGGQGMNLGWIGAEILSSVLANGGSGTLCEPAKLKSYSRVQIQNARKTGRRAEMNMFLGRKRRFPGLRNLFIRFLLNTPLSKTAARLFTMRGLKQA